MSEQAKPDETNEQPTGVEPRPSDEGVRSESEGSGKAWQINGEAEMTEEGESK